MAPNLNQGLGQVEPKNEPELERALTDLERKVDGLSELMESHGSRLIPILGMESPDKQIEEQEPEYQSPVAIRVAGLTAHIRSIHSRLSELNNRLEV